MYTIETFGFTKSMKMPTHSDETTVLQLYSVHVCLWISFHAS